MSHKTSYHVVLHKGETGFCYQAHVDSEGWVIARGSRAALSSFETAQPRPWVGSENERLGPGSDGGEGGAGAE